MCNYVVINVYTLNLSDAESQSTTCCRGTTVKCCRASGLSPGEDPTHPSVQAGCVFLKANFAPTPSQIPVCLHLCSCLPTSLRNPTFHLRTYLGLPVYFRDNVHVNKEIVLCAFSRIATSAFHSRPHRQKQHIFFFFECLEALKSGRIKCVVLWLKMPKKQGILFMMRL